jgi:hypothetical protein
MALRSTSAASLDRSARSSYNPQHDAAMGFLSNLLGSGTANVDSRVVDLLFGDQPIENWPAEETTNAEPWVSFIAARSAIRAGNLPIAIERWQSITEMPDLESRHYVQAWTFLRNHGVSPASQIEKNVLGMILERESDVVAVYSDHRARYFENRAGGLIWERPDSSLDQLIDEVLAAAGKVVSAIGPWHEPRRKGIAKRCARISFLTPGGLHFGEGPLKELLQSGMALPCMEKTAELRRALQSMAQRAAANHAP